LNNDEIKNGKYSPSKCDLLELALNIQFIFLDFPQLKPANDDEHYLQPIHKDERQLICDKLPQFNSICSLGFFTCDVKTVS